MICSCREGRGGFGARVQGRHRLLLPLPPCFSKVGNLSKPRRQTKGLMSRTIAVDVRYQSLYISLPFFAKKKNVK